jgi:hypothetical protein
VTKLTPEAKSLLSSTIRSLRERLLRDLRDAAEVALDELMPIAEGLEERWSWY